MNDVHNNILGYIVIDMFTKKWHLFFPLRHPLPILRGAEAYKTHNLVVIPQY